MIGFTKQVALGSNMYTIVGRGSLWHFGVVGRARYLGRDDKRRKSSSFDDKCVDSQFGML